MATAYTTYGCPVCAEQHPINQPCPTFWRRVRDVVREEIKASRVPWSEVRKELLSRPEVQEHLNSTPASSGDAAQAFLRMKDQPAQAQRSEKRVDQYVHAENVLHLREIKDLRAQLEAANGALSKIRECSRMILDPMCDSSVRARHYQDILDELRRLSGAGKEGKL